MDFLSIVLQVCPAQAITIEAEEREDGSRKTTRCVRHCLSKEEFIWPARLPMP